MTAFSLAYVVGAPVIALLATRLERRLLLAIGLTGLSIANLVAVLAPNYAGLLGARLLLALSAACFMPAVSGYAAAAGRLVRSSAQAGAARWRSSRLVMLLTFRRALDHAIKNVDDDDFEIVQTWDNGKFEEIDLTKWVQSSPRYLLDNNFVGVP